MAGGRETGAPPGGAWAGGRAERPPSGGALAGGRAKGRAVRQEALRAPSFRDRCAGADNGLQSYPRERPVLLLRNSDRTFARACLPGTPSLPERPVLLLRNSDPTFGKAWRSGGTRPPGSLGGSAVRRRASGFGGRPSVVGRRALGVGRRSSGVGYQASLVGVRASGVGRPSSGVRRRASGVGRRASPVGHPPCSTPDGEHDGGIPLLCDTPRRHPPSLRQLGASRPPGSLKRPFCPFRVGETSPDLSQRGEMVREVVAEWRDASRHRARCEVLGVGT